MTLAVTVAIFVIVTSAVFFLRSRVDPNDDGEDIRQLLAVFGTIVAGLTATMVFLIISTMARG